MNTVKRLFNKHSGCRGLLLWLLFSSMAHGFVLAFPYAGKANLRRGANIVGESSIHTPAIKVTFNHKMREVEAAPFKMEVPSPEFERQLGVVEHKEKKPREESSEMTPHKGLNLFPSPNINYYATKELTVRPQALGEPALEVGEISAATASGKIVLALWINEQGEVVNTSVESSDVPEVFLETAVHAFRKLMFSPGELDGLKVGVFMRIEVLYDDNRVPPH